jgi:thiol-disulfide isomerase/thioredoxin
MIFSQVDYRKYIGYLVISVVFIFFVGLLNAYELKNTNRLERIEEQYKNFPFSESPGYMAGGKQFNHTMKNEQNKEFSIADLKGQVVVILLLTTWCPNCPMVLQKFDSLVEVFRSQGIKNVKIIALNVGKESLNELKFHYKVYNVQLLDVYHSAALAVMKDVLGVPACFVFDKDGKPVWGHMGAAPYDSDEFIEFIKRLAK